MEVVNTVGRRKAAVARVYVKPGNGKITINHKELEVYFPLNILQYEVKQPLMVTDTTLRSTSTAAASRVRPRPLAWESLAHCARSIRNSVRY